MEKIILVDFLDREDKPNRIIFEKIKSFGGSRNCYGWEELSPQQIDRELDVKLRRDKYIIYQDFELTPRKV